MALGEYEEAKDSLQRTQKIRSRVYGMLKLCNEKIYEQNILKRRSSEVKCLKNSTD